MKNTPTLVKYSTLLLMITAAWAVGAKLFWLDHGRGALDVLGYFTVQSNLLVALFMAMRFFWPSKLPTWFHGGVTLSILITGIVYNLLLAPTHHPQGYDAINNILLHMLVPAWMVLDWFFTQKKRNYRIQDYWIWMIYPFLYAIFGSIEGLATGDFRYFFLDFLTRPIGTYLLVMASVFAAFFGFGGVLFLINRKLLPTTPEK